MDKYTILLVDDEEEVIQAIIRKINWEELGFSVVGYADNGIKALEMIEESQPDVVMTDIKITENYDLIVDGFQINLRSGAQKDLSSLAFRLSLGQSIILGMLPLFIGDEIDASSPTEVANDITSALETMSDNGYQILMITHKDISNLENCNIIDLG